MTGSRRFFAFFALLITSTIFTFAFLSDLQKRSWQDLPQSFGMGEWTVHLSHGEDGPDLEKPSFHPGIPHAAGTNYTKTLVMARMRGDDVSWVNEELGPEIQKAIYVADDPLAPLHPPKNRGHEVSIYLTYIIDNYDDLPDVSIFMHAHRKSWHNADIFGTDAAEMIRRLSPERVTREGYMNMRCQWSPGCPDWMHPGEATENKFKKEEVLIAKAWAELFPYEPVPQVLAQPCCGQFALSRDRIHAIPLDNYKFYRDWLLNTRLNDYVTGRIWEYLWQYVFTRKAAFCPSEHVCHCDGFGVCFGGEKEHDAWFAMRTERDDINSEWLDWEQNGRDVEEARAKGKDPVAEGFVVPDPAEANVYAGRINKIQEVMDERVREAIKRGDDPRLRALECGREYMDGGGY